MNKKRLGFLTTSGTIAAAMTIFFVVGIGFMSGGVLFSPGPLNAKSGAPLGGITSHAELSNQCGSCHAPFWGRLSMANLCENCHADLPAQLGDPSTLHGNLVQNRPDLTCRDCHPDHRGPDASLVDMSKVEVDHTAFGYSLTAHTTRSDGSPFTCTDCHTGGYRTFDQAICSTCHGQIKVDFMQAHLQAYGSDCLGCHDGVDTYGHAFNHSLTAYPLTGKHLQVTCIQCHTGDHTIAEMKATPQDCYSCHAKDDVHLGDLGQLCGQCHTTADWTSATFDHNLSIFKLTGKHAFVPCADCHIDKLFKGTPTECNACHAKDDVHQGVLGATCSTCHTTEAWTPSTFNHDLASFKLTGAHVNAACSGCHNDLLFKNAPSDCYGCHAKDDVHQGGLGSACSTCHTTSAWTPSTFNHNAASFKLTGAHANAACSGCHKDLLFKNAPTDCYGCHAKDDTHAGQFGTGCSLCHSTTAWLPSTFDHASVFPLTGGHAGLSCNSCHANGKFAGLSSACSSCHADPAFHAGLFSGTACSQCHNTSAWAPASYTGSHPGGCDGNCINHENASCRDCHTSNLMTATCTKCHDSNNPGGGGD